MTKLADRLKRLIELAADGKQATFARMVGIPASTVNQWVRGGSAPSAERLAQIVRTIPHFNVGWYLSGEGEPLLAQDTAEDLIGRLAQMLGERGPLQRRLQHLDQRLARLEQRLENLERRSD